jgi:hypothetical protein
MPIATDPMAASYCYLAVEEHTYKLPVGERGQAGPPSGPGLLKSALAALLGEPGYKEHLAHMKETPGRAEALERIVEAGALGADDAEALFPDRRITDDAWAILRRHDPDAPPAPPPTPRAAGPEFKEVRSWSLRILGAEDAAPIEIDPLAYPRRALPITAIVAALEELASDGWEVVHVSEDRGINDAADRSHVIAQRFLLARGD